ncbi:hypothetical protein niasHT_003860 [Heterodera trifolii]|uniref:Wiskott-Aldrich syndrome protein family member n=1 Tax=Heterodera trifolii TaxID=157864 RepID=A0ABD2LUZ9_9BILA
MKCRAVIVERAIVKMSELSFVGCVSPVNVCLHRLPASVQQDELQCVANGALANLIRQMSSLSRYAEQIFSEIHREMLKIDHRSSTLFLRVERLSQKLSNSQDINNLSRVVDQVGLEEASMRKAFKSCNIIDQHSLDRQTLPQSLLEQYQNCDPPPQLNQLNPYREDEKEALCYYTDPSYFFELWRNKTLKECDGGLAEKKRAGRSSTSPSRQRRRQQQQQHNFPQHNDLSAHHVSSRSTDYSRFEPQIGHQNSKSQQHKLRHGFGPGHFSVSSVAADVLHFPAEYQTPQSLMMGNRITHNQHPPPGMSMVTTNEGNVTQQHHKQIKPNEHSPFNLSSNHSSGNSNQHFRVKERSIDGKADAMTTTQTDNTSKNDAVHAVALRMDVMFLDDEDDELPPPPQNLLSSTVNTRNFPRIAPSVSSSSPVGSTNSSLAAPTNELLKSKFEFIPTNGSTETLELGTTRHIKSEQQPSAIAVEQRPNQLHSIQQIPPSVCNAPAPPPPPPPPPPPNFSLKIANEGTRTFGGQNENEQPKDLQRKSSNTSGAQDNRSLLLMQIQEGVKLRKVRQQEELEEKRAVATSNDVAAILRKRMEHCLGDSDSSSEGSPSPEDNEWDD